MSDLSEFCNYLSEIVQQDSLHLPHEISDEKGNLRLIESQVGESNRYVRIKNVPETARIIKIDNFELTAKFIRTDGALPFGKRCDYLILDPQHSKILLIELKLGTNRVSPKQVVSQLKGGRVAIDYIISLLRHFEGKELVLEPKDFRYLWVSYNPYKPIKEELSNRGQDIERPRRLKNASSQIYDYKHLTR